MLRKTREGAEQYAEPRMEIIELSEESVVHTSCNTYSLCVGDGCSDDDVSCFEELL